MSSDVSHGVSWQEAQTGAFLGAFRRLSVCPSDRLSGAPDISLTQTIQEAPSGRPARVSVSVDGWVYTAGILPLERSTEDAIEGSPYGSPRSPIQRCLEWASEICAEVGDA